MFEPVYAWIIQHKLEAFAMISGLIYIFLSVKHSIWLWPVGFITSALLVVVFFTTKLYADMSLQVYYLIVSLYGWYFWVTGKKKDKHSFEVKISVLKPYQWFLAILTTLLLGFLLFYPLQRYTDASYPLWDSMITSGSIVATWMLARKIIDQWILWIIIDGSSIALFLIKEIYMMAFLTLIYTIMAAWGYIKWYKDFKSQEL